MPALYCCESCGLRFQVGAANFIRPRFRERYAWCCHVVCGQCGTQHLELRGVGVGPEGDTVLLGSRAPEYESAPLANLKLYPEQGPARPKEYARAQAPTSRWKEPLSRPSFYLFAAYVILLHLLVLAVLLPIYLLRLLIPRYIGSWPVPEFEEWREVYRGSANRGTKDLACGYCGARGSLKQDTGHHEFRGIGRPEEWVYDACPSCGEDALRYVDNYLYVLPNGRRLRIWGRFGLP